jgi:hypothetical protein
MDATTPNPRPSHYYGRRQNVVTRDRAQGRRQLAVRPSADTSIVPPPPELLPAIDESKRAEGVLIDISCDRACEKSQTRGCLIWAKVWCGL